MPLGDQQHWRITLTEHRTLGEQLVSSSGELSMSWKRVVYADIAIVYKGEGLVTLSRNTYFNINFEPYKNIIIQ